MDNNSDLSILFNVYDNLSDDEKKLIEVGIDQYSMDDHKHAKETFIKIYEGNPSIKIAYFLCQVSVVNNTRMLDIMNEIFTLDKIFNVAIKDILNSSINNKDKVLDTFCGEYHTTLYYYAKHFHDSWKEAGSDDLGISNGYLKNWKTISDYWFDTMSRLFDKLMETQIIDNLPETRKGIRAAFAMIIIELGMYGSQKTKDFLRNLDYQFYTNLEQEREKENKAVSSRPTQSQTVRNVQSQNANSTQTQSVNKGKLIAILSVAIVGGCIILGILFGILLSMK